MALGWLRVGDGAQAECVSHRAISFWLHLLAWSHVMASEEPGAYPTENNSWTSNRKGTACLAFFPLFYCNSAFTAWIPPAIKLLSGSSILTKSFPRESARRDALTAVPLVRAVLAVPQAVAPLPVGDALVQLLALELKPAAASRERRGGGRHLGSCRQQGVRKGFYETTPKHGQAAAATRRDQNLSPGPDSTRWQSLPI